MRGKPISAKQRSIPVSFSVKPVLADRIEDMAYDQRFTRSKFLSEAVLRYINWIEMGGLEGTDDVSEMSTTRKVVIGINALQQAVSEEDFSVPDNILQMLDKALEEYRENAPDKVEFVWSKVTDKQFVNYGDHMLKPVVNGQQFANLLSITKEGRTWVFDDPVFRTSEPRVHKTLKAAKADAEERARLWAERR